MIHDPKLLEQLSALPTERFDGEVFRATRASLDPLAPSTSGGRWVPVADARHQIPVLYTSLEREGVGVDMARFAGRDHRRTQEIGAAVAFLDHDGLIVPSVRWDCENLVIFTDNHHPSAELSVMVSEEVDWQAWARKAGLFGDE